MSATVRRLAPPETEALAVTLDQIKAQVLPSDDEDEYLLELIRGAQELVETQARRTLSLTRWRLVLDGLPRDGCPIALDNPPLRTVESLTFTPAGETVATTIRSAAALAALDPVPDPLPASLEALGYRVDAISEPGLLWGPPIGWTDTAADHPVYVDYTAGYDRAEVPAAARRAIGVLVAHHYENREAILVGTSATELAYSLRSLVASLKWGDYS